MLMTADDKQERRNMAEIQQLRRDWRSAEQLREVADALRLHAAKLDAQVKAMQDLKATDVYVDGVTKSERGLGLIGEFITHIQIALLKGQTRTEADTRKRIKRS